METKQPTVANFLLALQEQVSNHSIYIWAASGSLCKDINEAWITAHEKRSEKGAHTADAIKAWRNVMASPYANVARCFDCSGYVSYCLIQIGALDRRRDCDGLYARCEPLALANKPKNGTLLFRVNKKNAEDETHVGVYFDGYQYHSKGRNYGVVKEKYKKSYWAKAGWFKALKDAGPAPVLEPQPKPDLGAYIFTRNLKYSCVGEDVIELKRLLIAHGFGKGITVDTASSKNFGSTTKRRVKEYQRSAKLKVDGIAGHDTIISLGGVYIA